MVDKETEKEKIATKTLFFFATSMAITSATTTLPHKLSFVCHHVVLETRLLRGVE